MRKLLTAVILCGIGLLLCHAGHMTSGDEGADTSRTSKRPVLVIIKDSTKIVRDSSKVL